MTPQEHYAEAERLIVIGEHAAGKIKLLDEGRKAYARGDDEHRDLTEQMDEYGKKCVGVWAQAQVHATLSLGPGEPYVPPIPTEVPF